MEKKSGEAYRKIRLYVDSYDQGVIKGKYIPPGQEESRPFSSLVRFLVETESMLDEARFPQAFTAKRTFCSLDAAAPEGGGAGGSVCTGKRATFDIRLLFRQHTSWQGTITWVEGRGEQSFRSVLELILLIDSALAGSG